MYDGHYHEVGGGWWFFLATGMVSFWALLAGSLDAQWRSHQPHASYPGPSSASTVATFQERYAHGEVTDEEYARRLAMLGERS